MDSYENHTVYQTQVKRSGYPLRPECIESLFYLYRSTQDTHLLMMAAEVVESIEKSTKTSCGYATVRNAENHMIEDRMESFFLAETLKCLYLIFAYETHFINNPRSRGKRINVSDRECIVDADGYVFNTGVRSHSPPIPLKISRRSCNSNNMDRFARIVMGLSEEGWIRSTYCDSPYSCDPDALFCATPRFYARLQLVGQEN